MVKNKGYIYTLTHDKDFPFDLYIGQTINPDNRKSCHLNGHTAKHNWKIRKFISKYGANSLKFNIIWEGDIEDINSTEINLIEEFSKTHKLFNICKGGEGIDPKVAYDNAMKKIKDGTHPFLQKHNIEKTRERNKKNMENGTFQLTSELAIKFSKERMLNGTHHFINNDLSKQKMLKRISNGIPYVIGENDIKCIIFWNSQELKDYNFNLSHVISVCRGRLKKHKGYKFQYHPKFTPNKT